MISNKSLSFFFTITISIGIVVVVAADTEVDVFLCTSSIPTIVFPSSPPLPGWQCRRRVEADHARKQPEDVGPNQRKCTLVEKSCCFPGHFHRDHDHQHIHQMKANTFVRATSISHRKVVTGTTINYECSSCKIINPLKVAPNELMTRIDCFVFVFVCVLYLYVNLYLLL